jgi:ABC-type uncharacterized transport system permease subunit
MARVEFNDRLVGSLVLFGIGAWIVATQETGFELGGSRRPTSAHQGIWVDATGLDAIAIGGVFIGLAGINLALGIRSQTRIKVFWCGAAVLLAALLYGLARAVGAIAELFG